MNQGITRLVIGAALLLAPSLGFSMDDGLLNGKQTEQAAAVSSGLRKFLKHFGVPTKEEIAQRKADARAWENYYPAMDALYLRIRDKSIEVKNVRQQVKDSLYERGTTWLADLYVGDKRFDATFTMIEGNLKSFHLRAADGETLEYSGIVPGDGLYQMSFVSYVDSAGQRAEQVGDGSSDKDEAIRANILRRFTKALVDAKR